MTTKKATCVLSLLITTILSATSADEKKPAADAPKPDAEAVFKKLDANADGKISKEEFLKGKKEPSKAEQRFGKLDSNSDGFLSPEEFKAGQQKKGS